MIRKVTYSTSTHPEDSRTKNFYANAEDPTISAYTN